MTLIQNKIGTASFSINTSLRKSTRYLWVCVGMLFACYLYFVGAITFSVINQQSLSADTKRMISTMSDHEVTYLAAQKTLTQEFGHASGLVVSESVAFATPKRALAWNVGQ